MKQTIFLAGIVSVFLVGTLDCRAEKWDKKDYSHELVESAYYDADSVKVQGKSVSWTEKYLYTKDGAKAVAEKISKHKVCKENIAKKGGLSSIRADYQIEKVKYEGKAKIKKTHDLRFRKVAERYYNKANEVLCTDKDLGGEMDGSWSTIRRASPPQEAFYDLVTKYKVNLGN
jgi:hypothetical protein